MDRSIVHFQQAIAARGQSAIVRRHQQGYAFSGGQIEQQSEDSGAGLFIQRSGWLIGKQNPGPVHQRATESGALTLSAGKLLNPLAEPMTQPRAIRKMLQPFTRGATLGPCGHRWNQAILRKCEIGDEVVQLKDEADLMPQQAKPIALAIDLHSVNPYLAALRRVEATKEMEQSALAAAGGTAECDRLALARLQARALQHGDGSIFIALPHVRGTKNNLRLR